MPAIMTVSGDESLLAAGFENGRVFVWHLPSGRLAGLLDNADWKLESSLANDEGQPWVEPPRPRSGSTSIIVGKPLGIDINGQSADAVKIASTVSTSSVSLYDRSLAWIARSRRNRKANEVIVPSRSTG